MSDKTTATSSAEEARDWYARLLAGDCDDVMKRQFNDWLSLSSANRQAFNQLDEMWRALDLVDGLIDEEVPEMSSPQIGLSQGLFKGLFSQRAAIGLGVVATLLIAVLVTLTLLPQGTEEPTYLDYATTVGEVKTVSLADGSTITMDAKSAIRVRLIDTERTVDLVNGRAYFDVAKDPNAPFSVIADQTRVRAIGTAFSVNHAPQGVRVVVEEGTVSLDSREQSQTLITAGNGALAYDDGSITAGYAIDADEAMAWRVGRFSFVEQPLSEIITDINRHRDVPIIISNSEIGELTLTTSFSADRFDAFLLGLEASEPVQIEQSDSTIIIAPRIK